MKANYDEALVREDRRVAERRVLVEGARRKLLPVMVAVCEVYGVSAGDILDSQNKHSHVILARNVVTYLGWEKCKLGPGILADVLEKSRPETSKKISKLRRSVGECGDFQAQVLRTLRKIEEIHGAL